MLTLILDFMSCVLTTLQTLVYICVDLFSHFSEPKASFHHFNCSEYALMTSVVMKFLITHCIKLCGTAYTWYVFLRMLTCNIDAISNTSLILSSKLVVVLTI